MKRSLDYNGRFFPPSAKKKYSREEEQLCEYVLWEDSQEEIKDSFLQAHQRKPSRKEIKLIFSQVIGAMKENGSFQSIIDDYRKRAMDEKAGSENSGSDDAEEDQESSEEETDTQNMGMQVEPK